MMIYIIFIYMWIVKTDANAPELKANSTLVNINETVQLTCTHSSATIVDWLVQPFGHGQFERLLSTAYVNNNCASRDSPFSYVRPTCSCMGATAFTCSIRVVNTNNNGEKWKCSVAINSVQTLSNEITLMIAVPVKNVTLIPAVPTISVLPNLAISYIRCVSSVGRPAPQITWYLDNRTPSYDSDDVDLSVNSSSSTVSDVTTSILTITPSNTYHRARIFCYASNGYGKILSDITPEIDVLSSPTKPTILYKTVIVNTISVIANRSVSLECYSSGNPTPNISWIYSEGSVINRKTIELKWEQRENIDRVICNATSFMQPTNQSPITQYRSTDTVVTILHPPSIPKCAIGNYSIAFAAIRAVKNEKLTINCTSKSNPPPMSYTWTLPSGMKQYGQQLTIPQVVSNGNYTLDVNNAMNATFEPHVIAGNANIILTLDVLYPVTIRSIANTTVLLNQALSVMCPYTPGNPSETSFTWIHVTTSREVGRGQTLALQNMQISDEGLYKCKVNNTMTPTGCCVQPADDETMFYVDVQYAANIKRFYATGFENVQNITVNESQTVILHCDSEGDPLAYMLLINNTRGGNDLLSEKYSNTISVSIPHTRCEYDMGAYQCRANNTHNKVQQSREIEIKILCSPRPSPFMPPVPNVWTKSNSSVILNYTIVAYPAPSASSAFVWLKQVNDKWLIINETSRLHIHISDNRLHTNLSIFNIQEEDFATYMIKVNNAVGATEHAFVIQAKEEPAMPNQFRVVEEVVTERSVTVEWIPRFNGGEYQWFVIGYKQETSEYWIYKNVSGLISRISIDGLDSGTSYQFKMYAENSIGSSGETDVITFLTRAKTDGGNSASIAAIGGGVGGSVVGLVVLIVLVVVIRKRRNNGTTTRVPFKKSKSKKKEGTVYENSLFRSGRVEVVMKKATTGSSDNPTYQHNKDTSETEGLQRTPSFVIVPEPLYGNAGDFKLRVRSIHIQELRKFTYQCKQDPTDVFKNFYSLDTDLKFDTSAARIEINIPKNRYRNMYPYDKNRVVLPLIDGDLHSDFINASFIDGYNKPKKYIAAQGPLERTILDIWRLIWAEKIQAVAMVTNLVEEGKRKCFQYWPDDTRNPFKRGHFKISLIQQDDYADFIIRKLECSNESSHKVHTVYHCHFTAWPDKDVPDSALSLVQFWRKVRSYADHETIPLLVHCSAGVGRTGTFITLDYLHDQGLAVHEINVHDAVKAMRDQRINMVQTKNQYLYIHELLCEVFDPIGSVVKNNEHMTTSSMTHSVLGSEFKRLREAEEFNATQATKDTLAAEDRFRPMLLHSATGESKYANAVYINTFREQKKIILTPSTAEGSTDIDFLWLLHDFKLATVVILNEKLDPYIPDQDKTTVTGPFSGKLVSKSTQSHYTELVVKYQYYAEHESFDVRFLHFSLWPKKTKVCKISDIMHLLIAAQDIATDLPVVVQCRDGYTRSGLFAVLWCIVERIKRDEEIAVAETVRMTKRRCQRIIPHEEQYRFCHEFAKQYAVGGKTYENTEDGIRRKK
ncbi:tyrosine-protein phosphatase Lar-like isoform X3 [Dreissena polymorpha]|uniref:tyrosine-protein phosphatase Lar-like isoform X3 n=1 Tax=Dreissena polymorpha TaxID=45954 RepID=UPI0022654D7B|nr:tyrosine-protein phosphatase Lar-like isoform X3 [Dreissena polymorpha]